MSEPHSSRSSARPGRMTAVMKAASTSGAKVLRVGVVRDGRVVEERVVKRRQTVTVGRSEKNIIVVAARDLPSTFELFELTEHGYQLHFTSGMSGRVGSVGGGIRELSELKGEAEKTRQGYCVPLEEDMRGKVVVGETTFLFQFVAPPPTQPRPQLPASVVRGAAGVDWTTTVIAAFSFLVHFLAIGLLYSDWMDPVVDSKVSVKNLVESIRSLPPPPELEEKPVEEQAEKKKDEKKEEAPEKKKPVKRPNKKTPAKPSNPAEKMSTAEVAALATELDSLDMGILASNSGKAATADVLSDTDSVSTGLMDQAAASGVGVSSGGPGGLKMGSAGAALAAGAAGGGLKSVGATGKAAAGGSGKTKAVRGPKASAKLGGTNVAGKVSGASRAIARMRAGFRACYARGIQNNPDAAGRIVLKIKVGAGGEVVGVSASKSGNLPASVVSCVKARARSGRFSPPEGGTAVVSVPVTFVAQQ